MVFLRSLTEIITFEKQDAKKKKNKSRGKARLRELRLRNLQLLECTEGGPS